MTAVATQSSQEAAGSGVTMARHNLSQFVLDQAGRTAKEVGFDYVAAADAPNTYDRLQATFAKCEQSGQPLPVSDEHSDLVVFSEPTVNFAMRFWHDVNHVRRGLSFGLVDELELSLWHLSVLEVAGFAEGSLEWMLLRADLVGQVYVMAIARRFPLDQLRFAGNCVTGGESGDHRERRQETV